MAALGGKAANRHNYLSALRISRRALGILDDAVRRSPDNPAVRVIWARTTREMPAMFGRKRQTLDDLLAARTLLDKNGGAGWDEAARADLLLALGDAHEANGEKTAARAAWREAATFATALPAATTARQRLATGNAR